jgi:hypothetical protein
MRVRSRRTSGWTPGRSVTQVTALLGLSVMGLAALGAILGGGRASAEAPAGSQLGSFSLSATAPGVEWTYDSPTAPTHPEADSEVPESVARLQPGPVGYGLGAVAWPGTLVANGGSTAGLVGLSLPQPLAANANEPVRAEARTGSGPPTVTNDNYPGIQMTATATDQDVSGLAVVSGTSGPAPSSSGGQTSSASEVRLTGPSSVSATATSTAKNLNFAGVVNIASVISRVTITSDGGTPKASGSTVVSGATIAGQPVSIDQSGIHVVSASAPLNAIASQIVNAAIGGAGMKIEVSEPTQTVDQGVLAYQAGSVVFYWSPPGSGGQTFTATVGGVSASVQAAPGQPASGLGAAAPTATGAATAPPSGSTSGALGSVGSTVASGPPASASSTGAAAGGSSQPTGGAGLVPAAVHLPSGISPWWVVLFLLGSGLMAAGLRRLPDRVLEEQASTCPLESGP